MSAETIDWLNTNTLIGATDERGNAWHYRAVRDGEESNHYPGAIPVEEASRFPCSRSSRLRPPTTTPTGPA